MGRRMVDMGHRLVALGVPSRIYTAGRVCAAPGCGTRLSIYNPLAYCSLHGALRSRASSVGVSAKRTPQSSHNG
jgi:hypothetical protein